MTELTDDNRKEIVAFFERNKDNIIDAPSMTRDHYQKPSKDGSCFCENVPYNEITVTVRMRLPLVEKV
jgi:hypothetical protein